jgi:hypothetical protein
MKTAKQKYSFERIISGLMCVVIIFICYITYFELKMAGFPDGHLTDYSRASRLPLTICNWLNMGFLIFFIYFYFKVQHFSRPRRKLIFLIVLYCLFLLFTALAIPYYLQVIRGLENGQGG